MTKKTLLLNATILLPQLVVAQSAELNEAREGVLTGLQV